MSLNPAKVRVEIFNQPGFFDDSLCKGWAFLGCYGSEGDTYTLDGRDGDVTIFSYPGFGAAKYTRTLDVPLDTNYYTTLIVRVDSVFADHFEVRIKYQGITDPVQIISSIVPGVHSRTLTAGRVVERIELWAGYGPDPKVGFDFVAIGKGDLILPSEGELVGQLVAVRPLLNIGVPYTAFSLNNSDGVWNNILHHNDALNVYLARDSTYLGLPDHKVFGGRISKIRNRGVGYGDFTIDVEGEGHSAELNAAPSLVQADYVAMNGKTIIENAIANLKIGPHPWAANWFGASGITDDAIASTHTLTYDEVTPLSVIQEICESASNFFGVKGFDFWEARGGVLVGHLRNSQDFVSPVGEITPRSYGRDVDFHPLRNIVTVFGNASRKHPYNGDDYSELISGWSYSHAFEALTPAVVGNYFLSASNSGPFWCERALGGILFCGDAYRRGYKSLRGWFRHDSCGDVLVRIFAPDYSNYFERNILDGLYSADVVTWSNVELLLGKSVENQWTKIGSPNWLDVEGIQFRNTLPANTAFRRISFDGLHFFGAVFSGEASDATSRLTYGDRRHPIVSDNSLMGNNECTAKAQGILSTLQGLQTSFQDVVADGDHRYTPGSTQPIAVAHDLVQESRRITQVKHVVQKSIWDSVLTLSTEPQLIDYVFRLLSGKINLANK